MRGSDECPRCGGTDLVAFEEVMWCIGCGCCWEPFSESALANPDFPLSPFKSPCNNCAFRKDSPERQDKEKFELLLQNINYRGAVFYCHKGVPLADDDSDQTHCHPTKPDGSLDTEKSRICAGYLNQRLSARRNGVVS